MENTFETSKPSRRDFIYFRQRQKNKVFQQIIAFFAKKAEEEGLTKKELAALLLDKDPATVTRWLKGPGNWTLDTMSDLLLAMGAEMDFQIMPFPKEGQQDISEPYFLHFNNSTASESSSANTFVATPMEVNV